MEAKELRLGNYVTEYNSVVIQVSCWEFEKARLNNNEDEMPWMQPIPLTEEWLMKFGFYKDINGMFLADVFELSFMEDDFIKNQYTLRIAKGICLKIKHVHQLQNLYFALTGEELETKTK